MKGNVMSAMGDIYIDGSAPESSRTEFRGLRDLLLALSVTILLALTLQAQSPTGSAGINAEMSVQDWRGNSGSLPMPR